MSVLGVCHTHILTYSESLQLSSIRLSIYSINGLSPFAFPVPNYLRYLCCKMRQGKVFLSISDLIVILLAFLHAHTFAAFEASTSGCQLPTSTWSCAKYYHPSVLLGKRRTTFRILDQGICTYFVILSDMQCLLRTLDIIAMVQIRRLKLGHIYEGLTGRLLAV